MIITHRKRYKSGSYTMNRVRYDEIDDEIEKKWESRGRVGVVGAECIAGRGPSLSFIVAVPIVYIHSS
jgi:hypothetical protein